MNGKWLAIFGMHQLIVNGCEDKMRQMYWRKAYEIARGKGKPMLVIGNPKGRHGCGDVTIDISPTGECPVEFRADVRDLGMFQDKQFGSVFCSHVLEHLPSVGDVNRALSEINRISEYAVVLFPTPASVIGWIHPDHSLESLKYLRHLETVPGYGVIEIGG